MEFLHSESMYIYIYIYMVLLNIISYPKLSLLAPLSTPGKTFYLDKGSNLWHKERVDTWQSAGAATSKPI